MQEWAEGWRPATAPEAAVLPPPPSGQCYLVCGKCLDLIRSGQKAAPGMVPAVGASATADAAHAASATPMPPPEALQLISLGRTVDKLGATESVQLRGHFKRYHRRNC